MNAGARGAQDQNKYLINIKDVKIENFNGEESKFPDFVEDTKTYADVINPELGEALEWLDYQERTLTETAILSKIGQERLINFNRLMTGFLKVRLRGKARNWLKAQPVGEGLLNWKRMLHKYDPMTGSTRLDMQNKITTPGTRCTTMKEVPVAIEEWDAKYLKYQQRMGKELEDEMMQNILLRRLPPKFEATLRMQIQLSGKETTYASIRQEILDMCQSYGGMNIATPMDTMALDEAEREKGKGWTDEEVYTWLIEQGVELDVDALDRKGRGKGKGNWKDRNGGKAGKGKGKGERKTCKLCKRNGHEENDCWCNPKSSSYRSQDH